MRRRDFAKAQLRGGPVQEEPPLPCTSRLQDDDAKRWPLLLLLVLAAVVGGLCD